MISVKKFHRDSDGYTWKMETYKNGILDGERKIWQQNGHLREHTFYKDGKLEGKRRSFQENGHPLVREFYIGEIAEGIYQHFTAGIVGFRWYFIRGRILDFRFSLEKEFSILCLKRAIYSRFLPSSSDFLIPDLWNTVRKLV